MSYYPITSSKEVNILLQSSVFMSQVRYPPKTIKSRVVIPLKYKLFRNVEFDTENYTPNMSGNRCSLEVLQNALETLQGEEFFHNYRITCLEWLKVFAPFLLVIIIDTLLFFILKDNEFVEEIIGIITVLFLVGQFLLIVKFGRDYNRRIFDRDRLINDHFEASDYKHESKGFVFRSGRYGAWVEIRVLQDGRLRDQGPPAVQPEKVIEVADVEYKS